MLYSSVEILSSKRRQIEFREAGKTIGSTKILSHMKRSRLEMKRQKKGL